MPAKMIPYTPACLSASLMQTRADALLVEMAKRRSCRFFSRDPVERALIEKVIAIGHGAPSGANRKPWRFVAVDDAQLKHKIRLAAEEEERENYDRRFPPQWLASLEPFGTDANKPFLEDAPWLVVMFRIDWEEVDGERFQNYYPAESTGIAAGMFLMACHQVGLATLTHTPSPMKFLRDLLGRPVNEKPFLLIPVGFPTPDCTVPDLVKKPLSAALQWNDNPDKGSGFRK